MQEASRTLGDVGAGHTLGRYELLIPIAKGGMAVVWAARLKGTRGFQKLVAVKTIRAEMSDDPQFEQMFLDEASLASRIRHPHVVEILDLGEEKKTLFIVMEWIDGEPLHVIMREAQSRGGIDLPVAVRIASQVCAGLHAAHELRDDSGKLFGVVHRDVTPQNVLVTFTGVAKLVDFGVAKAQGQGGETEAGQVKGKVAYMAPEQARGGVIDRRTDIFSIGILLYMMTTGTHPFRRDTDMATMFEICSDSKVEPPNKLVPGYPPELARVVMRALEKDPDKRFATANDMLRALDHSLPASVRASTDVEVAALVKSLLADRHEKRRAAIQTALRVADERTNQEKKGIVLPPPPASEPAGDVTVAAVPKPGRKSRPEDTDPRSERWTFEGSSPMGPVGGVPSVPPSLGAVPLLGPVELSAQPLHKRLPATLWVAIAALLVSTGVVVALLSASGKRDAAPVQAMGLSVAVSEIPPAAASTGLPAPIVSTIPAVDATAVESAEIAADSPEPGLPEVAHEPKAGGQPVAARSTGPKPASSTPPPTGKSGGKPLPQVRNPGF